MHSFSISTMKTKHLNPIFLLFLQTTNAKPELLHYKEKFFLKIFAMLELFTVPILQGFSSWHLCATVSLHYSSSPSSYSQIKTQHMQSCRLPWCFPSPKSLLMLFPGTGTPFQAILSLQSQLKS